MANFQPLLQGFKDIMREHFPPSLVNCASRDASPGATRSTREGGGHVTTGLITVRTGKVVPWTPRYIALLYLQVASWFKIVIF